MSSEGPQLKANMGQQQSIWQNPAFIATIAFMALFIVGFIYYMRRKSRNAF